MAEQKYIVDISFNWADEMDVPGFCILTESELNECKDMANQLDDDDEINYYCGTNEDVNFYKEDILDMLDNAKKISDEELKIINKYIPDGCENGEFFDNLFEDIFEEDDENEEEEGDDEWDDSEEDE